MLKPYFRNYDGWWYAQVRVGARRKQVKLVKGRDNEQRAYELFNEMKAKEPEEVVEMASLRVFDAFKLFTDWSRKAQEPATTELARHFLQSFVEHVYLAKQCGKLKVSALKPLHVTDWLADKQWNPTTRNRAISNVKRALNWCVEQGVMTRNPIKDMKKPRERRRETVLSSEERQRIVSAVKDGEFLLFLFALGQTGARPKEIRTVTAANLRDGYWEMDSKTTNQTGESRRVYLTPTMAALSQELADCHPEGPLFRNTRGLPWTRNAIRIRFRNLRKKLGLPKGVVAYAFRHTYITDALEKGVPIATLAELAGHRGTRMISTVYSKLSQRRRHLTDMAAQAVDDPGPQSRIGS
jgi:integrase